MRFLFGLWSAVLDIATFVIERWRIFVPLGMAIGVLLYIFHVQAQRDDAIKALASLSQYIAEKNAERITENKTKDGIAKPSFASLAQQHSKEIDKWRTEYDALQKKTGIANANLLAANVSNALWRERVRLELAKSNGTLGQIPEPAEGSTEGGGECDATFIRRAYDTLELACKITTSDYNALRSAWDTGCIIYGCEAK